MKLKQGNKIMQALMIALFISVIGGCGLLSNPGEVDKLLKDSGQVVEDIIEDSIGRP